MVFNSFEPFDINEEARMLDLENRAYTLHDRAVALLDESDNMLKQSLLKNEEYDLFLKQVDTFSRDYDIFESDSNWYLWILTNPIILDLDDRVKALEAIYVYSELIEHFSERISKGENASALVRDIYDFFHKNSINVVISEIDFEPIKKYLEEFGIDLETLAYDAKANRNLEKILEKVEEIELKKVRDKKEVLPEEQDILKSINNILSLIFDNKDNKHNWITNKELTSLDEFDKVKLSEFINDFDLLNKNNIFLKLTLLQTNLKKYYNDNNNLKILSDYIDFIIKIKELVFNFDNIKEKTEEDIQKRNILISQSKELFDKFKLTIENNWININLGEILANNIDWNILTYLFE